MEATMSSNSAGNWGEKNAHPTESPADIARRTGQSQDWAQEALAAARRQQEQQQRQGS